MQQLVDQFEWEPGNPLNSPEGFAQALTRDLGLGDNYAVAIAVAVRDQLLLAKQALLQGQPVSTAPAVTEAEHSLRLSNVEDWTPALYTLTRKELKKKQTIEVCWGTLACC